LRFLSLFGRIPVAWADRTFSEVASYGDFRFDAGCHHPFFNGILSSLVVHLLFSHRVFVKEKFVPFSNQASLAPIKTVGHVWRDQPSAKTPDDAAQKRGPASSFGGQSTRRHAPLRARVSSWKDRLVLLAP
jgi:hypothetical protein